MALTPWGGMGVGLSNPFLDNLERSIDRAFNRTFAGLGPLAPTGADGPMRWGSIGGTHPMDVVETEKSYEIHADAPGFSPEDIHVELHQDQITVRGEKQIVQEEKDQGGRVWRKERGYRTFSRTFALPENADSEEISASLDQGVLTVTVGKKPEADKPQPKRIQVQAAHPQTQQ